MMARVTRSVVAVLSIVAWGTALADDGPFDTPQAPVTTDAAARAPRVRATPTPVPLTVEAYRAAARFQGPRCPHRPSCSAYAAEALHRHGPVLGSFIGAARLLRGGRSSALKPLERAQDGGLLDPLRASTFFLEGPR